MYILLRKHCNLQLKKKKRKFTKIYTLLPVTANTILYNQKIQVFPLLPPPRRHRAKLNPLHVSRFIITPNIILYLKRDRRRSERKMEKMDTSKPRSFFQDIKSREINGFRGTHCLNCFLFSDSVIYFSFLCVI